MPVWVLFVLGAALSWGAYGPALHGGQTAFPDRGTASMRSLLCVGVAYFLLAVLVPLVQLWSKDQLAGFTWRGVTFSTLAGVLGALGAICIIWSFQNGGKPFVVMPLVFAGAPIVNALISMALKPEAVRSVNPLLFVGFALAAAGAWLVLRYKPA